VSANGSNAPVAATSAEAGVADYQTRPQPGGVLVSGRDGMLGFVSGGAILQQVNEGVQELRATVAALGRATISGRSHGATESVAIPYLTNGDRDRPAGSHAQRRRRRWLVPISTEIARLIAEELARFLTERGATLTQPGVASRYDGKEASKWRDDSEGREHSARTTTRVATDGESSWSINEARKIIASMRARSPRSK
jgi:hypothetical protein